MAFIPALAIAGAAISAVGAISQGQATANQANYQSAVASNNATIANQNADYAVASGLEKSETQSLKGAAQGGKIKASQAANGVDVNSGSPLDVQVGAREASELDSETVLNNSELAAYGYRSQATGFTAEAGLDKNKAEEAPIAGDLNAAGGLLSSASSIGGKFGGGGSWTTPNIPGFNPIAGVSGQ